MTATCMISLAPTIGETQMPLEHSLISIAVLLMFGLLVRVCKRKELELPDQMRRAGGL